VSSASGGCTARYRAVRHNDQLDPFRTFEGRLFDTAEAKARPRSRGGVTGEVRVDHGQSGRHDLEAEPPTPPRRGSAPEAVPDLLSAPDPAPLHWRTVAARLLIVAILLLGLMIGTGLLITRVGAGSDVEKADTATVQWLAGERTETLDAVSGPAAELGNTWVVIGVALVAAVLAIAVLRRWRFALVFAVALVGELAIFLTTTAVINRPRPPVTHLDAELPPTSSFPSGHTAASICLYGAIAALVLALTRAWWRWPILTLAVLVIVAVAVARLYRGAHFPTDVFGSVLFAVPWLLVTLKLLRPDIGSPSGDRRAAVGRHTLHDESATPSDAM
jgi:undecaprenyl-diphosphatase